MFRSKLMIAISALIIMAAPVSVMAAGNISMDKGSTYILAGEGKSSNQSVVRTYPSGIAVAAAPGKAVVTGSSGKTNITVRDQVGYSVKDSASFNSSVSVRLKAANGYKVYYTTGSSSYTSGKMLKSGKSKSFTFKSTTRLHVYALKGSINVKTLNKIKKENSDNVFIYTKYAKPSYRVPSPEAVYGSSIESIKLPEGFTWENSGSVGNAGTHKFYATFTPADTMKYKTVKNIPVTVVVRKASPKYSIPTGLKAVYGDQLKDIALPAGFSWESPCMIDGIGTKSYKVKYTPADTKNYVTVSGITVKVSVSRKNISGFTMEIPESCDYTGKPVIPEIRFGDLTEGKDYKIKVENNKNVGTARVTVTGIGNYTGTVKGTFKIVKGSQQFFNALVKMAKEINEAGITYNGNANSKTFEAAKEGNKPYNCALYVSWTLQEMGLIPNENTFWFNSKGHGNAYTYICNNPDKFTVLHPKKSVTGADLQPGDICGFTINGKAPHTAVYAGKDENGKPLWYSGGRTDFAKMFDEAGNVSPVRYSYYEQSNNTIYTVIRINWANIH